MKDLKTLREREREREQSSKNLNFRVFGFYYEFMIIKKKMSLPEERVNGKKVFQVYLHRDSADFLARVKSPSAQFQKFTIKKTCQFPKEKTSATEWPKVSALRRQSDHRMYMITPSPVDK